MERKESAKGAALPPRKKDPKKMLESDPQLTMTPMIDCVFQLLIFFMLTGKFVTTEGKLSAFLPKEGINLNLPDTPPPPPPCRVLLRWNPEIGRCKVYVGQVLCNYDDEGLRRALQRVRLIKQTGSGASEIDAGGDVPMVWVVQTLNMLIQAKMTKINFTGSLNPMADNK